jgi:hypothetical protein
MVLEEESALGRSLTPDEFLIVDDQFLIDHPQVISRVRDMRNSRVLILAPLAGSRILSRLDGLKMITKPVTIPSLYEAARGVVRLTEMLMPACPSYQAGKVAYLLRRTWKQTRG